MDYFKKTIMSAIVLFTGLQLCAENKDRVFVINMSETDIAADYNVGISNNAIYDKQIPKNRARCIVPVRAPSYFSNTGTLQNIGVMPMLNFKKIKSKEIIKKAKAGNVIVVDKNAQSNLSVTVYKNYAAFIAAHPDYQLDPEISCPHVLP